MQDVRAQVVAYRQFNFAQLVEASEQAPRGSKRDPLGDESILEMIQFLSFHTPDLQQQIASRCLRWALHTSDPALTESCLRLFVLVNQDYSVYTMNGLFQVLFMELKEDRFENGELIVDYMTRVARDQLVDDYVGTQLINTSLALLHTASVVFFKKGLLLFMEISAMCSPEVMDQSLNIWQGSQVSPGEVITRTLFRGMTDDNTYKDTLWLLEHFIISYEAAGISRDHMMVTTLIVYTTLIYNGDSEANLDGIDFLSETENPDFEGIMSVFEYAHTRGKADDKFLSEFVDELYALYPLSVRAFALKAVSNLARRGLHEWHLTLLKLLKLMFNRYGKMLTIEQFTDIAEIVFFHTYSYDVEIAAVAHELMIALISRKPEGTPEKIFNFLRKPPARTGHARRQNITSASQSFSGFRGRDRVNNLRAGLNTFYAHVLRYKVHPIQFETHIVRQIEEQEPEIEEYVADEEDQQEMQSPEPTAPPKEGYEDHVVNPEGEYVDVDDDEAPPPPPEDDHEERPSTPDGEEGYHLAPLPHPILSNIEEMRRLSRSRSKTELPAMPRRRAPKPPGIQRDVEEEEDEEEDGLVYGGTDTTISSVHNTEELSEFAEMVSETTTTEVEFDETRPSILESSHTLDYQDRKLGYQELKLMSNKQLKSMCKRFEIPKDGDHITLVERLHKRRTMISDLGTDVLRSLLMKLGLESEGEREELLWRLGELPQEESEDEPEPEAVPVFEPEPEQPVEIDTDEIVEIDDDQEEEPMSFEPPTDAEAVGEAEGEVEGEVDEIVVVDDAAPIEEGQQEEEQQEEQQEVEEQEEQEETESNEQPETSVEPETAEVDQSEEPDAADVTITTTEDPLQQEEQEHNDDSLENKDEANDVADDEELVVDEEDDEEGMV
eukprot:TRINITY_DN463_c2_g3_i1.p1 TRINITY_DN463_c2_g3~~TRINITY_DN463_c2_g3_i1.p1  ORF type:complete len:892 (+),score=316.84 TRINITY_DN463_c2_g3_i1:289-2964(+)